MTELPKDLQEAQDKINIWYKADALKQLIGKFYTAHSGSGYPTSLRRIYQNEQELISVDEYDMIYSGPNLSFSEFKYKTYTITESINNYHDNRNFSECEGKVWHTCLKRMLGIKALETGEFAELKADKDKEWKRMCDYKILSEQNEILIDKIKKCLDGTTETGEVYNEINQILEENKNEH